MQVTCNRNKFNRVASTEYCNNDFDSIYETMGAFEHRQNISIGAPLDLSTPLSPWTKIKIQQKQQRSEQLCYYKLCYIFSGIYNIYYRYSSCLST